MPMASMDSLLLLQKNFEPYVARSIGVSCPSWWVHTAYSSMVCLVLLLVKRGWSTDGCFFFPQTKRLSIKLPSLVSFKTSTSSRSPRLAQRRLATRKDTLMVSIQVVATPCFAVHDDLTINVVGMAFYCGYILGVYPITFLAQKYRPGKVCAAIVFFWGIVELL